MNARIARRFAQLKAEGRTGFIPFITGGDPTFEISRTILEGLPQAGADLIEIGMPFSDPMAEGKPIQASSLRALQGGQTMARTFSLVRHFRTLDRETPLILMGYYNPVHAMGPAHFCAEAAEAGADGLILVDLPPEEDRDIRLPASQHGLSLIRLTTPTSDAERLKTIGDGAPGFVYHVSVTGVTGAKRVDAEAVARRVALIRQHIPLPVAVGFGIKTPEDAAAIAQIADAVVVGSALVQEVAGFVQGSNGIRPGAAEAVHLLAKNLAVAVHKTRRPR